MILKVKAMFNRQFKALMAVNLRLLNPQMTSKYRKKGLVGTKMTKKLLLQFVFNLLIFGVIYGFSMFTIDYSKMPGMFTSYILMFLILGISQSMFGIYNVFFAGKDLNSYAPLPFKQSEIFISKIVTVVLNIVPFTIPLVTILFLTGMRNGVTLPVNLVVSLISYLLVFSKADKLSKSQINNSVFKWQKEGKLQEGIPYIALSSTRKIGIESIQEYINQIIIERNEPS